MVWEYAVVRQQGRNAAELLNEWGVNSWELVSVATDSAGSIFYLKRPQPLSDAEKRRRAMSLLQV